MRILAFETATSVAAVAVCEDDRLLGEYILNHEKKHSEKLLPLANALLKDLGLTPTGFDVYAASTGPGSFTGLRIGITTVKAMAYAADKPTAGVPTLDALAFNAAAFDGLVCPMLDARNNQVYTALYKAEKGSLIKLTEYMGVEIGSIIERVRAAGQKTVFVGEAAEMYRDLISGALGETSAFLPGNLNLPRASSVAHLAYLKAAAGELRSCYDLVPFYLRKSQAERELERKIREAQEIGG